MASVSCLHSARVQYTDGSAAAVEYYIGTYLKNMYPKLFHSKLDENSGQIYSDLVLILQLRLNNI